MSRLRLRLYAFLLESSLPRCLMLMTASRVSVHLTVLCGFVSKTFLLVAVKTIATGSMLGVAHSLHRR